MRAGLRLTMPRSSVVAVLTGVRQPVQREFSALATSQFSRHCCGVSEEISQIHPLCAHAVITERNIPRDE